MKKLISILLIMTLFAFNSKTEKSENFRVEISYIGLPGTVRTNYNIDNEKVIAFYSRYDFSNATHIPFDKLTITKYDNGKIYNFIKTTDWSLIPRKLVTPTIDGYRFDVTVQINKDTFNFEIDNTYHSTFDSLFTIAQDLIPDSKKKKRKYALPYDKN